MINVGMSQGRFEITPSKGRVHALWKIKNVVYIIAKRFQSSHCQQKIKQAHFVRSFFDEKE